LYLLLHCPRLLSLLLLLVLLLQLLSLLLPVPLLDHKLLHKQPLLLRVKTLQSRQHLRGEHAWGL
jgi:hypothetical protein